MLTLHRDRVIYHMSADNPPAIRIQPGETISVETFDCYQGQLLPADRTMDDLDRRWINPATGPVYVETAKPGDMLKITIRKINLGPVGILDIGPNSGALGQSFPTAVIHRIPVSDGFLTYDSRLKIPVQPMIGVIGTAPSAETGPVSTRTPMEHGGNMDCTRISEGSILYLPVFAEGGLLALGDLHAVMGDGEVGNCGVEIEGEVILTIDLIRKDVPADAHSISPFSFPLIETEDQWIAIASADTLDEASEKVSRQMFLFLTQQAALSQTDAGMLIDMLGNLMICQIVNPQKTVRMEFPKWAISIPYDSNMKTFFT